MELFCASSIPCVKQLVLGLCLQISGHLGSRSLRSTGIASGFICVCRLESKFMSQRPLTSVSHVWFSILQPYHLRPSHSENRGGFLIEFNTFATKSLSKIVIGCNHFRKAVTTERPLNSAAVSWQTWTVNAQTCVNVSCD